MISMLLQLLAISYREYRNFVLLTKIFLKNKFLNIICFYVFD